MWWIGAEKTPKILPFPKIIFKLPSLVGIHIYNKQQITRQNKHQHLCSKKVNLEPYFQPSINIVMFALRFKNKSRCYQKRQLIFATQSDCVANYQHLQKLLESNLWLIGGIFFSLKIIFYINFCPGQSRFPYMLRRIILFERLATKL